MILKSNHTSQQCTPTGYNVLTCQNKAQLLVPAAVYRSTLLAGRKTLHALALQVPEGNGAAGGSHCPNKQCSESRHRHTLELCGLLWSTQVHRLPRSSGIAGLGVFLLWESTLAPRDVPWNENVVWHTRSVVTRFRGLQMQNALEPRSTTGSLWFRAPRCFIE